MKGSNSFRSYFNLEVLIVTSEGLVTLMRSLKISLTLTKKKTQTQTLKQKSMSGRFLRNRLKKKKINIQVGSFRSVFSDSAAFWNLEAIRICLCLDLPQTPKTVGVVFSFEKVREVITKVNVVALITHTTVIIIGALRQQNQRSWTAGVL